MKEQESRNILGKLSWKSEEVLDILMKTCVDIKTLKSD